MSRKGICEYITRRITEEIQHIKAMAKENLLDDAVHAENVFGPILNMVFGWNVVNINRSAKNAKGIDLIGKDSKKHPIIVQVTVNDTRSKIKNTFMKLYESKADYQGYHLYFFLLTEDGSSLREGKEILGKPTFIDFDHAKDIIDIQMLVHEIDYLDIEKLIQIEDYIKKTLDSAMPDDIRKSRLFDQLKMHEIEEYFISHNTSISSLHSSDLQNKANAGDVVAQYELGILAYRESDYSTAYRWMSLAANEGNKEAQFFLGVMHNEGKGCKQNCIIAFEWTKEAAEQGISEAQFNLGVMFFRGLGTEQKYKSSLTWFTKAAEQGDIQAQTILGVMYSNGLGIPQDGPMALHWYMKAADQNDALAFYNLGVMYDQGLGISQDDTKAVFWYEKAIQQDFALAQFNLGVMYEKGRGCLRNLSRAIELYQNAALQGCEFAQFNLGNMYYLGRGVPQDNQIAINWFTRAADQGNAAAQFLLGLMYYEGKGVAPDEQKALILLRKAAEQGHKKAQNVVKTLQK